MIATVGAVQIYMNKRGGLQDLEAVKQVSKINANQTLAKAAANTGDYRVLHNYKLYQQQQQALLKIALNKTWDCLELQRAMPDSASRGRLAACRQLLLLSIVLAEVIQSSAPCIV